MNRKSVQLNLESYQLPKVTVRLVQETVLYSDEPLDNPKALVDIVKKEIQDYDREVFGIVCLNSRNQPINFTICHMGTVDKSLVHPRDVFKTILLSNAVSFIAFHNHPAGSLLASPADLAMTERLIECSKLMDIIFLDHIIITRNGFTSILSTLR